MKFGPLRRIQFCLVAALAALAGCATPSNLYVQKQALIRYHDSGRYDAEVRRVAGRAMDYIHKRAASGQTNLVVVLDIDETAVSTWGRLLQDDFARKDAMFVAWVTTHVDPPIQPVLDLYRESQRLGVKVFFVTARRTVLADRTRATLAAAGYVNPDAIYFRPESDREKSLVPFKAGVRREIIGQGFQIIANLGDQASDLAGGYAERAFKLPNPFYYTP
jgi:predicted secreted acid phosphatase